jgi:hypothetical protein
MSDQPSPPTWLEWRLRYGAWAWALSPEWMSEWIVYFSRNWDFVKVVELVGKFAFLSIAVTWFFEADERQKARRDAMKAKHYRAWELINSARGSTGDGGRRDALKDLLEDGVSLAGAPLSFAELAGVNLPGAMLNSADFQKANLSGANLARSNLHGARLMNTDLSEANLEGAYLLKANLDSANLAGAKFVNADLTGANLSGAFLAGANFFKAEIAEVHFSSAYFCNTTMPDGTTSNDSCDGRGIQR